jgi:hypothetical protein
MSIKKEDPVRHDFQDILLESLRNPVWSMAYGEVHRQALSDILVPRVLGGICRDELTVE